MNANFQVSVTKLRTEVQAFRKAFASRKKTEYSPDQLASLAPEMSQVLQQDISILERNVLMMTQVIRRLKSKGVSGPAKTLQRAIDAFKPYIDVYKANLKDWTKLAKEARAKTIKKPRKVNAYLVRSPRKQANKTFVDLHYRALEMLKREFPENRNVHGWHSNKGGTKIAAPPAVNVNSMRRNMAAMQSKIVSHTYNLRRLRTQLNTAQKNKKQIEQALMDCIQQSM